MVNKEDIKQQVLQASHFRHATKVFDSAALVSKEDMEYILEVGRLSPSSIGMEPWRFIVLQNNEIKQQLKPISWGAQRQLDAASHIVLLAAKKAVRYDSALVREALEKRGLTQEQIEQSIERYRQFQTEDMRTLESPRALFDWASKQTYIAMGNMMTAAAMIGIDSCPIEGFHYEKVNEILHKEGVLKEDEGISAMIAFGYRGREPYPKRRKPAEEVITWYN